MRTVRTVAVTVVLGLALLITTSGGRAQVPGSVILGAGGTVFYGIGDFGAGGTNSIVQEATQVGNTVYAVGASTQTATNTPIPNLDTAVVWDSASNALTVVPDLATFNPPLPTSANSVIYAITPDALYMGGRLRNDAANSGTSNGFRALRTLGGLKTIPGFAALDISDNGNIAYGQNSGGNTNNPSVNNSRAFRSDVSGAATTTVLVPLLTPATITSGGPCSNTPAPNTGTCLDNLPAYRGMSADGSVMVGTAFTGAFTGAQNQYLTTNGLAFRWVSGAAAVTEIPKPAGGTWSSAIAISPNGNLTLVGGNSSQYTFGEVWIHNATTGTIQELGSPNSQVSPRLYGGMTADGSVVGVTFMGANATQSPTFQNNPVQNAYLHNSFGWFQLANVLTAQGVNLWGTAATPGWDPANMILTGIRTVDTDNNGTADVDLVFGQGRRRNADGSAGAPEGFVASFPIGVLAAYKLPAPAPVANRSLVGAWALGSDPNNPLTVMVLMADGTYYTTMSRNRAVSAGYGFGVGGNFERGVYTLTAGNAVTFTTTEDRDGAGPHQSGTLPSNFVFNGLISSLNGRQSLSVNFTSADTFTVEDATCSSVCSVFQGTRITGAAGSIAGAWTANSPPFFPNGRFIIVFLNSNANFKEYQIADGPEGENDVDEGTYVWDGQQFTLTPPPGGGSPEVVPASLTSDELGLFINDPPDSFTLTRIVNPSTVLPSITNATLTGSGTQGSPFNYTVTGVNTLNFSAANLPPGLTINASTGVISGSPTAKGTFNVTITATNTFGATDNKTLVLTFAGPATFVGIGDLPDGPGGVGSAVRDATRVNGVVYAVGASTTTSTATLPNLPNLDTPVLWTYSGGPTGTFTMLPPGPNFPPNTLTGAPADNISAYAITPAATFIASQIRNNSNPTQTGTPWGRVALPGLTNTPPGGLGGGGFAALSMADSGGIVYGQTGVANAVRVAIRYDNGVNTFPPFASVLGLDPALAWSLPTPRGTSTDGLVMVGVASVGATVNTGAFNGTNGHAFRYVHGTGTTAIPKLTAGGWNFPIGLSPDGNLVAVAGNSALAPRGEIYLYNVSTNAITPLGSPNTAWFPRMLGGMTSDGSVVAVTFASAAAGGIGQIGGLQIPGNNKYAYLKNASGWFHLASALAAQNIDVEAAGWDPTNMAITGIRTIEGVDLVFGQGRRRTVGVTNFVEAQVEGFVAEFPAGYLANFAVTPTPVGDTSIVGAWGVGLDPNTSSFMYVFMRDGTYYEIGTSGFERGFFTWGAGGAYRLWTRRDDNGASVSAHNGKVTRTITIVGDSMTVADTNCPGCAATTLTRVPPLPGTLLGGWVLGDPTVDDSSGAFVLTGAAAGGKFFFAQEFDGGGAQMGTWTFSGGSLNLTGITTVVHGQSFPDTDNSQQAQLTADGLGLVVTEPEPGGMTFLLTRVVNPATVLPVITNATLAASGAEDSGFSYQVQAINALNFSSPNLPAGLTIDANTGLISGTPAVNGTFNVTVTVTNTFGATDTKTLVLTFAPPPVQLYGIGDIPTGAVGSAVRDATRVNGTLYAVGASTANNIVFCTSLNPNLPAGCLPAGSTVPNLDTPALWTKTSSGAGVLEALPLNTGVTNTNTTQRTAFAITPDGTYIASQAQRAGGSYDWTRVTRNPPLDATDNANLSFLPSAPGTDSLAMSNDGTVNYGWGFASVTFGNRVPVRYQTTPLVGGVGYSYPSLAPTGKNSGFPIPRGTSSDGLVMVGAAYDAPFTTFSTPTPPFGDPILGTNTTAFRYVHNAGTLTGTTTVIPKLSAATSAWNFPIAISSDGAVTVVAGNSDTHPNGEIYLTSATNTIIETLGSPNRGMTPRLLGGRTDDGTIVVTFATNPAGGSGPINGLLLSPPAGSRFTYFHNANGWFLLGSVLREQGIDLEAMGWNPSLLTVSGVRTVEGVDLLFGQGMRRTLDPATGTTTDVAGEGFVIELPAGLLGSFNPSVTAPSDDALVGGWVLGTPPTIGGVIVMKGDGRYVSLTQGTGAYQNGSERGSYTWSGNGGEWRAVTRFDANSTFGQQNFSNFVGRTITVTGDTHTLYNTHCNPGVTACSQTVPRIVGTQGDIVGAWSGTVPNGQFAGTVVTAVFLDPSLGSRYLIDYDIPGDEDEFELGTYTYDAGTHTLTLVKDGGNGTPDPGDAVLSRDGLSLVSTDDGVTIPLRRVVVPASVAPTITSALTASGTFNQAFTYQVTGAYIQTVGSSTLPAGLSLDSNTGVISGTPAAAGQFTVDLTVTNTLGATANATLSITIAKATQATLSAQAPPSAVYGSSFTATASGGTVNGAITFLATNGCSNVGGAALITMTSGTTACSITATMAGDDNYEPIPSSTISVTANKANTTTSVGSSLNPSTYGQAVTLTATTSSPAGVPVGSVTFYDGAAVLGTVALNGSGQAALVINRGFGSHSITATYGGNPDFNTSATTTLSQSISRATTTTTLTSSPNPSSPGQEVTFVATVTGQYGGTVFGLVTFFRGANTVLGTVPVTNGVATLKLTNLGTGSHAVRADYGGEADSLPSGSAYITQNVVAPAAPTTTTLTTSLTPAIVGQSVTLTAGVTSGTAGTISGTVTFKRGQTVLATVNLVNGQASYTTNAFPQGSLSLTAAYSGDAQYITSTSGVLNQVITQATTTTSLNSSPNPSNGNQLVTLTATIGSGFPGPMTGQVTFKRGQTVLGTANVSGNQASMTTTTLPAGASNLTAVYEGNATYVGSTSTAVTHTVNIGTTTTTLTSTPNPSRFGTAVTFTATVTSTLGAVPTGSVEFSEGNTVLGTTVVDATGHATFTTSTLALKNGKTATHNVKAKYLGDTYNTTSTSPVAAQVVNP